MKGLSQQFRGCSDGQEGGLSVLRRYCLLELAREFDFFFCRVGQWQSIRIASRIVFCIALFGMKSHFPAFMLTVALVSVMSSAPRMALRTRVTVVAQSVGGRRAHVEV
jgi:hypothetical protein